MRGVSQITDLIQARYNYYLRYAKSINPNLDYEQDVLHEVIADNSALPQYVNPEAYIKRCIRNKYTKLLSKEIPGIRLDPWVEIGESLFYAARPHELRIGSQCITEGKSEGYKPPTILNHTGTALKSSVLNKIASNPWPAIEAAIDVGNLLNKLAKKEQDCISAYHFGHEDISDVANRYGIQPKSVQKVCERAIKKLSNSVVKLQ